jgi:glucose/arabinose dehydrogenase
MRTAITFGCLVTLSLLSWSLPAQAAIEGLQRVASGLAAPIFVTHAPGDTSRLFIAQRSGQIRILDLSTGVLQATPFLSTTVDTSGEGGLLGLAFHPEYSSAGMPGFGKFYLNVTTGSPFTTRIREFSVSATDPNLANAGSQREILSFAQPQTNHNGGWLGFSPRDNFLYIASGDGGGGNDEGAGHTAGIGNAQDTTNNLLGKMLRIDVNSDAFPTDSSRNYSIPPTNPFVAGVGAPGDDVGDDEIWSYGLRNPFRASFDRQTGDLWIGDVGQGVREEIDFQPASSAGGENFGWRLREGLVQTPGVGGAKPADNVDPVYDYDRNNDQFGGTVVSGGYVYRGPDPDLQGRYFFLDSRNSAPTTDDNYWMFNPADPFGTVTNIDSLLTRDVGSGQFPVSFGEDALGNLYIAYIASGEVYRIRTTAPPVIATWNVDNDGNWSIGSNWTGGMSPNGAGQSATLGPIITADRALILDVARTVGAITFDNADGRYTIAGPNMLTLDAASGDAAINVTTGSHTISAPVTLADNTTFTVTQDQSNLSITGALTATGRNLTKAGAGTLTVNNLRAQALAINGGAVALAPSGGAAGTSVLSSLTIAGATDAWTARLDLMNNDAIVQSTAANKTADFDRLYNQLKQGFNNGTWNGQGVTSTTAAANATNDTGLSVVDNALLGLTDFSGQPVTADSIILKYTYYGDIDQNGQVDADDLTVFANNFGRTTGATQINGDIDFNGAVNADDLTVFANNFNKGVGNPLGAANVQAVPEPRTIALMAIALTTIILPSWLRSRSKFHRPFA